MVDGIGNLRHDGPPAEPVALSPVVGRVRSPALEGLLPRPVDPPERSPDSRRTWLALTLVAVVGAAVVALEWRYLLIGVAFGAFAWALRMVDRRTTVSFGNGFLRYRGELGWPRGVQEDDDFRWSWSEPASARDGQPARSGGGRVG